MTGPQEPAAGGGRLRASDAEREQALETLKTAFVHGRLARDELDARVGRALTARFRADLAALTADIPPDAAVPAAPATPARSAPPAVTRPATQPTEIRRPLVKAAAWSGLCLVIAATSISAAEHLAPFPGPSSPRALVMLAVLAILLAIGILLGGVAVSVHQRRARGQLPPPSGPGGRAPDAGQRRITGRGPGPGGPGTEHTRFDRGARKPGRQDPGCQARIPRGPRVAPGAARVRPVSC
jgi:Domain of unknown function (DUF1707)